MASAAPTIPAHVPGDLVRDFSFATAPGVADDPYAAASVVFDWPDIFFSPIVDDGAPAWVVSRIDQAREVYQAVETFSSVEQTRVAVLLGEDWALIPVQSDPPDHGKYRAIINPVFSPKRMAELEDGVRETCVALVEGFRHNGGCEFVGAFGRAFPVTVFLRLMGLPLDKTDDFVAWEEGLLHATSAEQAMASARATRDYAEEVIRDRRANPRDDLTSLIANAVVDGRTVTHMEAIGLFFMFYLAGLDTVTSALGFIFRRLAERQDLQAQLRDDPGLIPNAIEELLRLHGLVESKRTVTRDTCFHGIDMKAGDRVFIATPISGRDAREFPDPDRIDFARENVRHLAFAAGPHRCIGSHLARRELKIALEEWLARVPPFRVAPGAPAAGSAHIVWQLTSLPLEWDAAPSSEKRA